MNNNDDDNGKNGKNHGVIFFLASISVFFFFFCFCSLIYWLAQEEKSEGREGLSWSLADPSRRRQACIIEELFNILKAVPCILPITLQLLLIIYLAITTKLYQYMYTLRSVGANGDTDWLLVYFGHFYWLALL